MIPHRKCVDVERARSAGNWPTPNSAIFRRQNDVSFGPEDQIADKHPVSCSQLGRTRSRRLDHGMEVISKTIVQTNAKVLLQGRVEAGLELCPSAYSIEGS